MIVRTAFTKYTTKKKVTKDYADALECFYDDFFEGAIKDYDSDAWRNKYLWNEDCDLALKHGIETLKSAYTKFMGKEAKPGEKKYMCNGEFCDLISQALVYTENFGQKIVSL